ncbi:BON domain-containing protein [Allorhizobium undicola]|uniref:BON domain-containing protein n=1 Tax=Allorhizobium undicola TaxID=78527 RepID=UPI003D353265
MAHPRSNQELSGEEEFRDRQERDLRDGWPYSDTPGASSQPAENRAYGDTPGNFDRDTNGGYSIDSANAAGAQEPLTDGLLPETQGRENADEMESQLRDRLDLQHEAEFTNVEMHAEGHIMTLTGSVDTNEERHLAGRIALTVPGVRHVINHIETLGVDTHQPDEE